VSGLHNTHDSHRSAQKFCSLLIAASLGTTDKPTPWKGLGT
jgi:hypothetical protein